VTTRAAFLLFLAVAVPVVAQLPTGDFSIFEPRIDLAPHSRHASCVVASRDQFLVVWMDYRLGAPRSWAARVSREGEVLDPIGIPLSQGSLRTAVSDGSDFLVVTDDFRGTAAIDRVAADGSVTSLPLRTSRDKIGELVWIGEGYASFYVLPDVPSDRQSIAVQLLDRTLADVGYPWDIVVAAERIQSFRAVLGSGGRAILLGWSEPGRPVRTRLIDVDALRRGDVPTERTPPLSGAVETSTIRGLASDGDGYLVTWETYPTGRARRIDAAGNSSADVDLGMRTVGDDLTWDGRRYVASKVLEGELVFLSREGRVLAQETIDAPVANALLHSFAVIGGEPLYVWGTRRNDAAVDVLYVETRGVVSELSRGFVERDSVSMRWRGDHYLAVWRELAGSRTIVMNRMLPNGSMASQSDVVLDPAAALPSPPSVASDGRDALVVWSHRVGTFDHRLRSAFVTHDGTVRKSEIGAGAAPVVHWNGSQYLVAFITPGFPQRIAVMRFRRDGTAIDPQPVVVQRNGDEIATISSNGQTYLVTWWERTNNGGFTALRGLLSAVAFSRDLVQIGVPVAVSANYSYDAAAAGVGPDGYLVAWRDDFGSVRGSRFRFDGMPLDASGGFTIGPAPSRLSAVIGDSDGWTVIAGADAWTIAATGTVSGPEKRYPFVPGGSQMTLVLGGPAPLAVYRRPALAGDTANPILARYVPLRNQPRDGRPRKVRSCDPEIPCTFD
jgi:hypothetical protein